MPPETSDLDPREPGGTAEGVEGGGRDGGAAGERTAAADPPEAPGPAEHPVGEDGVVGEEAVLAEAPAGDQEEEVIEELEDFELLEEEDLEMEAPPRRARTTAPPPPPTTPPAAAEAGEPDSGAGIDLAELPISAEPGGEEAADAGAPEVLPAPTIETPTALDRLLDRRGRGDWKERAEELRAELDAARAAGEKKRAGTLAYELGELYERRLEDEASAVKAYGQALQADPSLRSNLWAIRRVFYRRGLWPNLIKLIGAEVRFVGTDADRADLKVEKGHIHEDRLGHFDDSRAAYEQALAYDPGCVPALLGLERLALRGGDDDTLARLWRALADASTHPERKLSYLLDLAQLHGKQGDEGMAEARAAIAEAAALGVRLERVARERERLAERAGDLEELVEALESQIAQLMARFGPAGPPTEGAGDEEATEGAAELRRKVVALRRRQAGAALRQDDDAERAWGYLQEALALSPGDAIVLADLADIAERLGRFDELAELVEGWESQEADPARALGLSLRRADALLRSGQADKAQALLSSLAASAPGFLPILSLRERDALTRADWRILAEVYVASADAARLGTSFGPALDTPADPAAAAADFVAAGDVYARLVKDPEEARTRYGQALESLPGYPPAVEALTSLHERAGRLQEATELLELHSESGETTDRILVLERLARLYDELEQPEERAGALRRLAELAPEEAAIRWRLEETLDELGEQGQRAAVLEELADRLVDADQRAALLLEAARIYDQELDDAERAAGAYRRVLELWPSDSYARGSLVALLRRSQRWEELVAERRAEAEQLPDGPAAALALREAAAVLRDRLGRGEEAASVYADLVERVPEDLSALRGLAEALAGAAKTDEAARGRWLEVLEREAEAQSDPQARAGALLRLATGLEASGRHSESIQAYRQAAEAGSVLAAVALTDLAAQSSEPQTVVEALEELSLRVGPALRAEVHEEIGWLWAATLGDPDRALEAFRQAAEVAGDELRPGAHLGAALVESKQKNDAAVAAALARLAGSIEGSYAQAALLLRSSVLAAVRAEAELSREYAQRALDAAPDEAGAVVVAAEHLGPPIADPLAPEQAAELAELYGARAALAGDAEAREDWTLDRAEALAAAGKLGDAGSAVISVLESRPDQPRALQLMRRLCRRGGDRPMLARASLALARSIADAAGKLELLREAAAIFDGELGELDHAVAVYRRILAAKPDAPEYERLHEIFLEHDDIGGLYDLVSQRVQNPADGEEKIALLLERSRLRERIGDLKGASRDLAALLDLDPVHLDAQFEQAHLLVRLGQPKEAADVLDQFVKIESDPKRRAEAELTLSQVLAESMDDLAGAIEQIEHVVRQSPSDAAVRERLIALLMKAGDSERAIREIREVATLRASQAERARDELRVAALYRDKLEDPDGARGALERARQLDPLNIDAVRELVELATGRDKRQVVIEAAGDVRRAISDTPARAPLYERLAVIMKWLDDGDARYFVLSALEALGAPNEGEAEFVAGKRKSALSAEITTEGTLSPDAWRTALVHQNSGGFAAELWEILVAAVVELSPHEPTELGFQRGARIKGRDLPKRYPFLAQTAQAFGATGFEVFVSEKKEGYARAIGGDKQLLLVGSDVAEGRSARARFALGRALAQIREGTGSLLELRPDDLALYFAAAATLADVSPLPRSLARVGERESKQVAERARALQKALGRKSRKNLALAASRFSELDDPAEFRRAALATASRAGLLLAGDLAAALDALEVGRGARGLADDPSALGLLAWAVGEEHMVLRRTLGLKLP